MVVSALGRIDVSGNSQNHVAKLVDPATGIDVPNGERFCHALECDSGHNRLASLASPVTFTVAHILHLTQETLGADQWYDTTTTLETTADATVNRSICGAARLRATAPMALLTEEYSLGTASGQTTQP